MSLCMCMLVPMMSWYVLVCMCALVCVDVCVFVCILVILVLISVSFMACVYHLGDGDGHILFRSSETIIATVIC